MLNLLKNLNLVILHIITGGCRITSSFVKSIAEIAKNLYILIG